MLIALLVVVSIIAANLALFVAIVHRNPATMIETMQAAGGGRLAYTLAILSTTTALHVALDPSLLKRLEASPESPVYAPEAMSPSGVVTVEGRRVDAEATFYRLLAGTRRTTK